MNMNIGHCAGLINPPGLQQPDFWINKIERPYATILNAQAISDFNNKIAAHLANAVYNLHKYPNQVSKQTLGSYIEENDFPTDIVFINSAPATTQFYKNLRRELNVNGIQEVNTVQYGFTVQRSNLRAFPTSQGVFSSADDQEFDIFQETAVDPSEPVIVLHRSSNGQWLYVQTYNYRGWILAKHIALARNKNEWTNYMDAAEFLVVAANKLQVELAEKTAAKDKLIFEMGAKIPLATTVRNNNRWTVKLPVRNKQGMLDFQCVQIADSEGVNLGFLPYNRANIINQAYKFLGQRYGWGGLHDSVDCSSMIAAIYRCFGFKLPRNADQQESSAGVTIDLHKTEVDKQLDQLPAGTALFMDGHTMLYLGKVQNNHYIIHSLASYGDNQSREVDVPLLRVAVMKVVISDLGLTRRNGKTFKDSLTNAKIIE